MGTLSDKVEHGSFYKSPDSSRMLIRELDVKQAINKTLNEIENINPLKCIRDEVDPDSCSCIACVRDTMRNDIKIIFKQNFGDASLGDPVA